MMPLLLVIVPALGALSLLWAALRPRAVQILIGVALASLAIALRVAMTPSPPQAWSLGGIVGLDVTSRLFLAVVNAVFLGVSVYAGTRAAAAPSLRGGMSRFAGLSL